MQCKNCGAPFEGTKCPYCHTSYAENVKLVYLPVPDTPRKKFSISSEMQIILISAGILVSAVMFIAPFVQKQITETNRQNQEQALIRAALAENERREERKRIEWQKQHGIYQAGTYHVGEDIEQGLYLLLAEEQKYKMFCLSLFLSEDAPKESEIFFTFADTCRYIELEDGEYLSFDSATLYDIRKTDASASVLTSGMYLVGRDIEAGHYTLTIADAQETCYYAVLPDTLTNVPEHQLTQNTAEITLHDGEFLEIRNCVLEK